MRTEESRTIRLVDYRPSDWMIDTVDLDIALDPTHTKVRALLSLRPNPAGDPEAPLVLDGDELSLKAIEVDGTVPSDAAFVAHRHELRLHQPPRRAFTLLLETELDPSANTKLMGLYRSSGVY